MTTPRAGSQNARSDLQIARALSLAQNMAHEPCERFGSIGTDCLQEQKHNDPHLTPCHTCRARRALS